MSRYLLIRDERAMGFVEVEVVKELPTDVDTLLAAGRITVVRYSTHLPGFQFMAEGGFWFEKP